MRRPLRVSFTVVATFLALHLTSCGATEVGDEQAGREALTALRADIRGGTPDFAILVNLSTLVGEVDYARCMQNAGLNDFSLDPSWPAPNPDIEAHLADWSTPQQELAQTMLGPVDDLDSYGLGQAYQHYGLDVGTRWTREWGLKNDRRNSALFDNGVAIEFDNMCYLDRPAAEGWLYTEAMDELGHEYSLLVDELTDRLDLTDCGPQWMYGDRDGEPFDYNSSGAQFPTNSRSAGSVWATEYEREVATAEKHSSCRAEKLASRESEIADAVNNFRDRNGDLVDRAAVDWTETGQILDDLVNNRINVDSPRILERRNWSPDWAIVHGESFATVD